MARVIETSGHAYPQLLCILAYIGVSKEGFLDWMGLSKHIKSSRPITFSMRGGKYY